MFLKNLLIALLLLALGAPAVYAKDKEYTQSPGDQGMASQMLQNWGHKEGVLLQWEASYDIELAYALGKSTKPVRFFAPSARVAMQRFIDAANRERRALELAKTDDTLLPPPLFACYFEKSRTFVVREEGQMPCDGPEPAQPGAPAPAN